MKNYSDINIDNDLKNNISSVKSPECNTHDDWDEIMKKILGFGENSLRKNYYPQFESSVMVLHQKEEYFRALIENSSDIIMVIDENAFISYCSQSATRILGYSSEEMVGKSIYLYIHPEDENNFKIGIRQCVDSLNTISRIESRMRHQDGTWLNIESFANNQLNNFAVSGIIINSRDITEHIQAQAEISKLNEELEQNIEEKIAVLSQLTEYDKLKTEFFANISHEFRTPLNVILGSLQLLELKSSKSVICGEHTHLTRHSKIVRQNCFRLLRLINNLLDITKIDSNFMEVDLKNNDIVNIVQNTVDSVIEYTKSKGLELIFSSSVKNKILACDSHKIERIILNLISNSIKFTEAGGKITVKLCTKKDSIYISVSDTGIGIAKEKQKIIFDRFAQADNLLTRRCEGSGIGLYLVKSLVEMHSGSVSLKSDYCKGSTFMIKIPMNVLPGESEIKDECTVNNDSIKVERIKVEFSDIYFDDVK
ncbi:UNVERIFIED_CONTAM: PAS domain S-box-containing protein [Acetivibrio alkalicellulosi]